MVSSTRRGPIPDRNNKFPALRACGYKPTGFGAFLVVLALPDAFSDIIYKSNLLKFDTNVFWLGEKSHGFPTSLTTQAGLLHAPKRRTEIPSKPTVHPNNTRLQ